MWACSIYVCMQRTLRSLCYVLIASCFATWALPRTFAHAEDVWTDPYPGVRHLHRTLPHTNVHMMLVDLTAPEVSIVATRPSDRGMPVRDFARRYDAQIAINANYFDGGYKSCGMAAGDGEVWNTAYVEGCDMSIGFGRLNEAMMFDSREILRGPVATPWMSEVVSGKPWLVREGVAQGGWLTPGHIEGHHPRTALGLTQDRHTLIILVVDGRHNGVRGWDGNQLAEIMTEFGAYNAFNLDGGGSSELYVAREGGTVNRPSDGRGRGVGNHLGIRIRRAGSWYSATLSGSSPAVSVGAGATAQMLVTYRNTGRMPWAVHDVVLGTDDERPSAMWHPEHWLSTTTAATNEEVVPPGGFYTFAVDAAAPIVGGDFQANFVPKAANGMRFHAPAATLAMHVDDVIAPAVDTTAVDEFPAESFDASVSAEVPAQQAAINEAGAWSGQGGMSWLMALVAASFVGLYWRVRQRNLRQAPRNIRRAS